MKQIAFRECTLCQCIKSEEDFYKKKARKDGLDCWCKECVKASVRGYYKKNHDERKEYSRKYRELNPEKSKECNKKCHKQWYEKNKQKHAKRVKAYISRPEVMERMKQYKTEYYKQNRQKIIDRMKQWTIDNRERYDASRQQYRIDNAERRRAYTKQWAKEHPEKAIAARKVSKARRRSNERKVVGHFTSAEWLTLVEFYGGKCPCCGRSDVKLHADHVIPISRGGTNSIDNIQPLCGQCNQIKLTKKTDYRMVYPKIDKL